LECIRVLLVELEPLLLRDITTNFLRRDGVDVVGRLPSREALADQVARARAEIVVLGLAGTEFPPECRELLVRYPRMKVLGVAAEGRRGFLYELRPHKVPLGELDPKRLLDAIRDASHGAAA
jgi:DNA-binding NarL/FixJ family response regulator